MSKVTLYEYLEEHYNVTKLKQDISCINCGTADDLIKDPDTDSFVCEFCAKHSYYDRYNCEVIWCDAKKGVPREN